MRVLFLLILFAVTGVGCGKNAPPTTYKDPDTGVSFQVPGGFVDDQKTLSIVYFSSPSAPGVKFQAGRDWSVENAVKTSRFFTSQEFIESYKKRFPAGCQARQGDLQGKGSMWEVEVESSQEGKVRTSLTFLLEGPEAHGTACYFEIGVSAPKDQIAAWRPALTEAARSFQPPAQSKMFKP